MSKTNITKFNIRVYGIVIINESVLLTDEFRFGMQMTKFAGGGLEFGEGTADCLKREFHEELGVSIQVKEHIYTTDYFQPTLLLRPVEQLISIYYRVEIEDLTPLNISLKSFDFKEIKDGAQLFRWEPIITLDPSMLTFPIDQKVVLLLKDLYLK